MHQHSIDQESAPDPPIRILAVSLYSEQYPAIGENYGLSAVTGAAISRLGEANLQLTVVDKVEWGEEDSGRLSDVIRATDPHILAIGLQYGTFSFLQANYKQLRAEITHPDSLVVIGGPLATYLSNTILQDVAPDAVVILGEADESFPRLVQAWIRRESDWSRVPGLHFIDRHIGVAKMTPRRLVDLGTLSPPNRSHIGNIAASGGQIFIETSRGCSWAACTFCLRGMTDIQGRSHEYRRKPPAAVAQDLNHLADLGVREVTIADEDFLGGPLDEVEEFAYELLAMPLPDIRFDASLTVHSVSSRKDSPEAAARRRALLESLAQAGLQKVFLGIESGSPTQLKRYAKGHIREEAARAAGQLRDIGIRVEVGVILFDPLCTLDEIEDSLRFMRSKDLASVASGISSEIRLQRSTHYMTLLEKYEKVKGIRLHSAELDPDTLSYAYTFADPDVALLHALVKEWNKRLHSLYYPAKSLSRFGSSGALGDSVQDMRIATNSFRDDTCDAILTAIRHAGAGEDFRQPLNSALAQAGRRLAHAVFEVLGGPGRCATHPVVLRALAAAHAVDNLTAYDR